MWSDLTQTWCLGSISTVGELRRLSDPAAALESMASGIVVQSCRVTKEIRSSIEAGYRIPSKGSLSKRLSYGSAGRCGRESLMNPFLCQLKYKAVSIP